MTSDPGYNAANLYRNKLAIYFLPSLDEWHKAAYYDPAAGVYYDYPTGSDSFRMELISSAIPTLRLYFSTALPIPGPNVTNVGLLSPFGTAGQGGNATEWEEKSV